MHAFQEKKVYSESEFMLTDSTRPMAYLIDSHQMFLFEAYIQCADYKIIQFEAEMFLKVLSSHQHTTLEG